MKKLTLFAYLIFVLILGLNAVYYNNLYQKQLNYIIKLLSQQVQLIGSEVGETNLYFESDVNKIFFGEPMESFFSDETVKSRVIEKLKFFYTKYDDFVVNITMHNTKGLEFDRVIITGLEEGLFPGFRNMENIKDYLWAYES